MTGQGARQPRPLRPIFAFGACFMAVPVMPVYVPFLHARGVGTAGVLDLQAILSLAVVALDLPTGVLCDWIGRRRTLVLGAACNAAGMCGFALAHGFAAFAAAQLVLAAGWALVSGADVALIYDVLDREEADRGTRRRALGAYTAAQVGGEAAAAIAGGALATVSLSAVGWAAAGAALAPLALAFFALPDETRHQGSAAAMLRSVPGAARALLADATTRLLFANWITWGLSTFIAVWLLQPYWVAAGIPLRWFGPLWAGTLGTVAVCGLLAPRVVRRLGDARALGLVAMLPVAAYGGMAMLHGAAGVAAGFGFYASRGLNGVVLREAANHRVPAALRATFNSLGSGGSRLGFALLGPLVGLAVAQDGLRTALAMLAALFGCAAVGLAWPLARCLRSEGGDAT